MRRYRALLLAVLSALAVLPAVHAQQRWTWELNNDRYKQLNAFQRAQYDKAAKLFREQNYDASAAEFEKFKIQFQDSDALPYVIFMIGYSQHLGKQRNAAIKTYNEVLDYFGDVIADAAPALYFLGIAQLDNGDLRLGITTLKEMVDDEDYQKHPLAAGALRRLADNEWKNQQPEAAVRYWKQVVRDFEQSNPEEANIARAYVIGFYVKNQDYTGYEAWRVTEENRADAPLRRTLAQQVWEQAYYNFHADWGGKYTNFNQEVRQKDMRAFYAWFKQQQTWYDQAKDSWSFYHNLLLFSSHRLADRPETKAVLEKVVPMSKALPDEVQRNDRFAWLSDRLREGQDWEQASYVISHMTNASYATFKDYEVLAGQGKWPAAIKRLEEVEAMADKEWAARALGTRAYVYLHYAPDYEKCIALYQQINNPPHNLWQIQEAYRRWGKLKEALATLGEIEASFPDQAPEAAWHKASYLDAAGDKPAAIAAARRILKIYPDSKASSNAHQLLEKYGIATGGGLAE